MNRVLFVRHGETTWNRESRIQGWASTPLTGRGRDQARATGRLLRAAGVDRVVASDLQRARETARLLREGPQRSARYGEGGDAGRARGRGDEGGPGNEGPRGGGADAVGADAAGLDAPLSFDRAWRERDLGEFQGLDRSAVVCQRVTAGWESLRSAVDRETVAVVTHGGPLRAAVAAVTGLDVPTLAREWSPSNCGVTEVDVSGTPEVVRRDDTSHLE
ncbi:hypothetical protein BRC67_07265 [Halobacteriales archaeon QH_3_68_24]|nr:MAG: hypothetical protein BRC67_07265 [Halobacteriales archaeon QH_3_68_24]